MKYARIHEKELKNKVTQDFFGDFDCTEIAEKIDFAVKRCRNKLLDDYSLWAEVKAASTDVCEMLTQLVLTIGKTRTFDKISPPLFLGCFDREKIAFIPYHAIQEVFYQNDFNWKVAPSNRNTREFKHVRELIKTILTPHPTPLPEGEGTGETYIFDFEKDEKVLKQFIRNNFIVEKAGATKILINKNNFISIYFRWLKMVKSTIAVNWELVKKTGIIDGDFYLADLLSQENKTLKEKLFVLLQSDHYALDRKIDAAELFTSRKAVFIDKQKAHHQFWAIYERPPHEEYWNYLIERRNLLVPQDVRERKGSFFTPRIWVELSQKYIADVLGENWQDEYYVWDCAAGTGNLLAGLTNKYHVWASTLDKADVDIMHDKIENGANLLKEHTFQFDFLNDDLSKLPKDLRDIINGPNRRKKLIVYFNPPYVEGDARIGKGRKGTQISKIHEKYQTIFGKASAELSTQFFGRIYLEIPDCIIAAFSKMNFQVAPNYEKFRNFFLAKTEKMFIMPSVTFDNVNGKFPISFKIWNTSKKEHFDRIDADVYNENGHFLRKKSIFSCDNSRYISDWLEENSKNISQNHIGHLGSVGNDFQNQNTIFIDDINRARKKGGRHTMISIENLIVVSIYFAVRKVIPADWLNDRDQFLYPNDGWKADKEFQNDCLAYTLFSNNIQSQHGINHWIPSTESEVNARSKFKSNFMTDFIAGKIKRSNGDFFSNGCKTGKMIFSAEAKAVFKAGRKLWTYYHTQPKCNVNASLYDIREHFQGRNDKGKMNNKSDDETYNILIADLRYVLKTLAMKIEQKVYEYGFLRK